jgi:hypothetical protein
MNRPNTFTNYGVTLKRVLPATGTTGPMGVYSQNVYISSPINNRKERVRKMLGPESTRSSNTNSIRNSIGGKRRSRKVSRRTRKVRR